MNKIKQRNQKKQLRKQLIENRLNLINYEKYQTLISQIIYDWLKQNLFNNCVIGTYYPIKKEFNTLPILERWQSENKNMIIALPKVENKLKIINFHIYDKNCLMSKDVYGIPYPKNTKLVIPDLIFIPCVGYSNDCFRLGYGGGFYDRSLLLFSNKPKTVGLAFSCGFIEDYQPENHDIPLDLIITEKDIIQAKI